jgi:hypothetical protein
MTLAARIAQVTLTTDLSSLYAPAAAEWAQVELEIVNRSNSEVRVSVYLNDLLISPYQMTLGAHHKHHLGLQDLAYGDRLWGQASAGDSVDVTVHGFVRA